VIAIVTDGFWWGPLQGIKLINMGGAPWPCPQAPTFAIAKPMVMGRLVVPSVSGQAPDEIRPPRVAVRPGPSVEAQELIPGIAGDDGEDC
jgi:hypothetical protein